MEGRNEREEQERYSVPPWLKFRSATGYY